MPVSASGAQASKNVETVTRMNKPSTGVGHRRVLFSCVSDFISDPFPVGANFIAIITGRGRAIFLEAHVSFKASILKTKASVVTSENFGPLLREEARRERKWPPLGTKQEEFGEMMLKKSKARWGEGKEVASSRIALRESLTRFGRK